MRRLMTGAVIVYAVAAMGAGCSPTRYDAGDFPEASSRSGGVTVRWSGRLADIRMASSRARHGEVQMEGERRSLTLVFIVRDSSPVIPPFVPGKRAVIATSDAAGLLGTNLFKVGGTFEGVLVVWRAADGGLKAKAAGGS